VLNRGGEKLSVPPVPWRTPPAALIDMRHDGSALPSTRAVLSAAGDFLADAVVADQPVLYLGPSARLAALRRTVRTRAQAVTWVDTDVLVRNPARLLPALGEFVSSYRGVRVRALVDLSVPRPAGPVRDELYLHEFLLNTGECQSWPLDLRCCYDIVTVGAEVAEALNEMHHRPASGAEAQDAFEAELPPPPSAVRFPADITTLAALREFVHRHATAAGVAPDRIDDLAYAVNEVVTNSICHGAGHADLSVWTEPTFFCCDVRDRGRITDPLVGRVKPEAGAGSGRGLWLVHHLCDLVQVRSSSAGTTVRMRIDRNPAG